MILSSLILIASIAVVVRAADWFLGAAERVGVRLRLSPFILGVVLVGFGTSLPEFATSMAGVIDGVDTVTIANVAGSNIANILVIIGVSTIILGTIKFEKNLIDLDIPLLLGITSLFAILLADGGLGRVDGVLLLVGFAGYLVYSLGYKEDTAYHKGLLKLVAALAKSPEAAVKTGEKKPLKKGTIPLLLVSIVLLAVASKFAVDSLLAIVEEVNIVVDVLSFFALAIGTSLPEFTVSVKSLRAGKGDLVAGNIVGSNMFNILLIGGFTSVIRPQTIDQAILPWIIIGMLLSVLLITAGSISKRIHIWEGFVYLLLYLSISSYII